MTALLILVGIMVLCLGITILVGKSMHCPEPPAAPDVAQRRKLYDANAAQAQAAANDFLGRG